MLDNRVIIELQIPLIESELDKNDVEIILEAQAKYLVSVWKGVVADFKDVGVPVPTISLRAAKAKAKSAKDIAYSEFRTKLIDHHLAREPQANVAQQMQAIGRLFETGRTAEELIALYDESVTEYALTTWHTVKYRLGKAVEPIQDVEIVPLPLEQQENLKQRFKQYG